MLDLGVVIPVYNVEKYLPECLDSILLSLQPGIKIVLVNDGSTDGSGKICERYVQKSEAIKVIHTRNNGVSVARNIGIDELNTKYITFIDSDDIVSSDFFLRISDDIINNNVELYHYKHSNFSEINNPDKDYDGISCGVKSDNKEMYIAAFERRLCYVWDKVYRTDIIKDNKIYFPVGIKTSEDLLFNAEYLKYIKSVFVSDHTIYYHRSNPTGVAYNPKVEHFSDICFVYNKMMQYLKEEGFGETQIIAQNKAYLRFVGFSMVYYMLNKIDKDDIFFEIKKSGLNDVFKNARVDTLESKLLKYSLVSGKFGLIKAYYPVQKHLRNVYHAMKGSRRL